MKDENCEVGVMKTDARSATREARRCIVAGVLFVFCYWVAGFLLKHYQFGPTPRLLLCLLPAPAFLFFVWVEVRALRRQDELRQRIQLEALAIAYPLAIAIVITLSLAQQAGLLGREPMWIYLPITYFIGLAFAQRRYR